MTDYPQPHVFFAYSPENQDSVEALARRLHGDARLSFWFAPWHSVPGTPIQEQMEDALTKAQSCAVFISGAGPIAGWQSEQMRTAIQTHVEDAPGYRVIPVLLPGAAKPSRRDLPPFLRRYEMVEFRDLDDEQAFKRLIAGILGIPPIQVDGYIEREIRDAQLPMPPARTFQHGHALVIGVANYPQVSPLPQNVLDDARGLYGLLTDPGVCGYTQTNVKLLLDGAATGAAIRASLADLSARVGPDDTTIVFFSGHGAHDSHDGEVRQYILPYDCDLSDLRKTALAGDEMTALLRSINAGRLLMFIDSCHSGGAGDPKAGLPQMKRGLSEEYYEALAQGKGRVVIASSRPDELSWTLRDMHNSLFTHYLLEALRGQGRTLGDGYVRVFDVFRHVAEHVPARASQAGIQQHPIFKASAMEDDFPLGLVPWRS
jgi:metacaspase-1